ncbi:MAG: ribulose-phosphate 3-epimerase, partial [Pseudomonadota bacterium]|nr:ribulose-phosphate 3-epimerase [Pseudomonadota bacterium]
PLVTAAGAQALVAGSAIFKGDGEAGYRANIEAIRKAAQA